MIIWGPNCPQWVFAFFGCVRAGAIIVPIDIRSTQDFLRHVVNQSQPVLALTSSMPAFDTEPLGIPALHFENLEALTYQLPEPSEVPLSSDDVAEIMYTSGTTGDPKGVMLTHGNLMANLGSILQHVIPNPRGYRLLSLLPLSHMFEQMGCMIMGLGGGASITFAISRQPTILFKIMQERKLTMMLLVPQALELFMNGIEAEVERQGKTTIWLRMLSLAKHLPHPIRRRLFKKVHARFGGHLEYIVSGGAALDADMGQKWNLIGVKVLQGYGATEASPGISSHTVKEPRFDSVGRPLPGVEVRIADDGEIQRRGDNITPGYWQAPDHTAEAFDGAWYKSGDIGFVDDEGFLHIMGRKKDIIVLPNGQNVIPDDIEAELRQETGVTDAAVVGMPGSSGQEVHAALVANADGAASAVEAVNQRMTEHQQIRGFTIWPEEDFPRTHTLKVKKNDVIEYLSNLAAGNSESAVAVQSSGNAGPVTLLGLLARVSGIPALEITPGMTVGNDLGLDSLGRVELLSSIEQELGVYIDESLVSSPTTVAQLEVMIDSQQEATANLPRFYKWPITLWFKWVRELLHHSLPFPILTIMYKATKSGTENLASLHGPSLFAANHNAIQWDSLVITKVTPRKYRRQLSFAAAAEITFAKKWLGTAAYVVANAFPLSRENAIRPSLEHLGHMMDSGWNVVIFPEGDQHVGQPMLKFQSGTGLLCVESNTPVVPVGLTCTKRRGSRWFPFREHVTVQFGKPITFTPGTTYEEATRGIESAVRELHLSGGNIAS
ncbi:MAG: hypothetical protein BZY79_00860 [SAR202 cluster bacterium Casp-Chloro-G4]|nr:MAG: hypothetical protein BZY79_00860 [SAR202 cluster bacterium Casp-Chloro-G4]